MCECDMIINCNNFFFFFLIFVLVCCCCCCCFRERYHSGLTGLPVFSSILFCCCFLIFVFLCMEFGNKVMSYELKEKVSDSGKFIIQ